jgi:hypothetical protein
MKTPLAAALALLCSASAHAQSSWGDEPKTVAGKSTEAPECAAAREPFAAYTRAFGIGDPPPLAPEKDFAASAAAQRKTGHGHTALWDFKVGFTKYRDVFTACANGQHCSGASNTALTPEGFKAAAFKASSGGADLPAAGRWMCALSRATFGYFGFYGMDSKNKEGYFYMHNSPAEQSIFVRPVFQAYAEHFNSAFGTRLKCPGDISQPCEVWGTRCEQEVTKAVEERQKEIAKEDARKNPPKRDPIQPKEWAGAEPGQHYQYRVLNGESVGRVLDWVWGGDQLNHWHDCIAATKQYRAFDVFVYKVTKAGLEGQTHKNRGTGNFDQAACEAFHQYAKGKDARWLPILPVHHHDGKWDDLPSR